MVALLSFLLTDEQFLAWGWRIAFLLSGVMVLVGMYIRLRIQETPEFAAVKARNAELRIPFMDMIRRYPGNVLKGNCAARAPNVTTPWCRTSSVSGKPTCGSMVPTRSGNR